jgi:hypothetical protein
MVELLSCAWCGTRATLGDSTPVDLRILQQLQGLLKKPTSGRWHKTPCAGKAAAAAEAARRAAALLAASSKHATRSTTQQVAAAQPPQRRAYRRRVSEAEQLGGEVPSSGSRRTRSTSSTSAGQDGHPTVKIAELDPEGLDPETGGVAAAPAGAVESTERAMLTISPGRVPLQPQQGWQQAAGPHCRPCSCALWQKAPWQQQ